MSTIQTSNREAGLENILNVRKVVENSPGCHFECEDQLVKTPTIGRFQVFFSALHATRVGMTPWRRDWVRWKAEIQEMDFKKISTEIFYFFMEKFHFENFVSDFFENMAKSYCFSIGNPMISY